MKLVLAGLRGLGLSLLALLALVLTLVLGAVLALQTQAARDLLRDKLDPLVSEALGGKLVIGRIDAISLDHVQVSNAQLYDKHGKLVAKLARADITLTPLALLANRLHLRHVRLVAPYVDLGDPSTGQGGLLALFEGDGTEPVAPPTPPGKSLVVQIDHGRIEGAHVVMTAAGSRFDLTQLWTVAGMRLDDDLALHVYKLTTRVFRDGSPALRVHGLIADYAPKQPSRALLAISAGPAKLRAKLKLGAAALFGSQQEVSAELEASEVSGETLARAGLDGSFLTAPISLQLTASGTTEDLHATTLLHTPGGDAKLTAQARDKHKLTAELRAEHFEPARFLSASLPPLAAHVQVTATANDALDAAEVELHIDESRYDTLELPRLRAKASLSAARITLHELVASYREDELTASGSYETNGKLSAEAHVHVSALEKLQPVRELAPGAAGAFDAELRATRTGEAPFHIKLKTLLEHGRFGSSSVEGLLVDGGLVASRPDNARVDLAIKGTGFHVGDTDVAVADVRIAGGPDRYGIKGAFGMQGKIDIEIARRAQTFSAHGGLEIAIAGDPLKAQIDQASYRIDGPISVQGVGLEYRRARARVDGSVDPNGKADVTLNVDVPDLAYASRPFTPLTMTPLHGTIALDAHLTGRTKAPQLTAALGYRCPELLGLSNVALDVHVDADLEHKQLATDAHLRAKNTAVDLHYEVATRGSALSVEALEAGEHQLELQIGNLPASQLSVWPSGEMVPDKLEVSGHVELHGKLDAPQLKLALQSHVHLPGAEDTLATSVNASYEQSQLELQIKASDRQGELIRTQLKTELARQNFATTPDALERWLIDRSWDAKLWLGARRAGDLPLTKALGVPEAIWPARVSASLELAHVPNQEPKGKIELHAAWDPARVHSDTTRCGYDHAPLLELAVNMQDGDLTAELHAKLDQREVMLVNAKSHAPLNEWLQPVPERVEPVDIVAQLEELRLSEFPMVCDAANGRISGTVKLSRAVTEAVSASVDLKARDMRWAKAPKFNANLVGRADKDALLVSATFATAGGTAKLDGKLPLDIKARVPSVPLDGKLSANVDLRNLDASAVMAPVEAVRVSAGHLDGQLALSGTLRDPMARGQIMMRDLSITLAEIGQRFERVQGTILLEGRQLKLQKTRVHDRDGWADVSGELSMVNPDNVDITAQLNAHGFPMRRSGVLMGALDGDARVHLTMRPQKTDVQLTLRKARMELTDADLSDVQGLDPEPEIKLVGDVGSAVETLTPKDPSQVTTTTIDLDASEPFWIRREDFSALVSTHLKIVLAGDDPSIVGTVDIERGTVELIGQSFDILEGHIALSGGHDVEPTFNLTAQHKAPGGSTVTLTATGNLHDPQLAFQVDGKVATAGEALAAATGIGNGQSSGSSSVQGEVGSMASGVVGGVLTMGARRELGAWVPTLNIETGAQTRVRAGFEADRFIPKFMRKLVVDAYVEGIVSEAPEPGSGQPDTGSGWQNQTAVLLELRFPKHLVGEAQYGPGLRWSLDLGWEP